MKKNAGIIICILLFAVNLSAQSYIRKYSESNGWYRGVEEKGESSGGNLVTEVTILEEGNGWLSAKIERRRTPYPEAFSEFVMMYETSDGYQFEIKDHFGNRIEGTFMELDDYVYLSLDPISYSENGRKVDFLYDGYNSICLPTDTTNDPDFFEKAVHVSEIKDYLTQFGTYWPKDSENAYVFVNYVGVINGLSFYDTEVWINGNYGETVTRRMVLLKDGEYCGNYPGIPSELMACAGSKLMLYDIDESEGNAIDFSNGIPEEAIVGGIEVFFQQ